MKIHSTAICLLKHGKEEVAVSFISFDNFVFYFKSFDVDGP